jgi:hypothetical protein
MSKNNLDDFRSSSPWWFYPPERRNGRIFVPFFNVDDTPDTDPAPVLALLRDRLRGKVLSQVSIYNVLYEIKVYGIIIALVDDNWPSPHLSAAEADAQIFDRIVNDVINELRASVVENKPQIGHGNSTAIKPVDGNVQ